MEDIMPKRPRTKVYLGDAVYAEFDGWHIVLTTSNGIQDTNRICLDPGALAALFVYNRRAVALPPADE